jgi:hypothetical protein
MRAEFWGLTGGAFSTHSESTELKIDAEPGTDIWNVLPLLANSTLPANVTGLRLKCRACGRIYRPCNGNAAGVSLLPTS